MKFIKKIIANFSYFIIRDIVYFGFWLHLCQLLSLDKEKHMENKRETGWERNR